MEKVSEVFPQIASQVSFKGLTVGCSVAGPEEPAPHINSTARTNTMLAFICIYNRRARGSCDGEPPLWLAPLLRGLFSLRALAIMPLLAVELLAQLQARLELETEEARRRRCGAEDVERSIWRVAAAQSISAAMALLSVEPLQLDADVKTMLEGLRADISVRGALEAYFALRDQRPQLAPPLRDVVILCVYAEVGHRSRAAFEQVLEENAAEPLSLDILSQLRLAHKHVTKDTATAFASNALAANKGRKRPPKTRVPAPAEPHEGAAPAAVELDFVDGVAYIVVVPEATNVQARQ